MRKNENIPRNGEERKGFWRIGYLENQDYAKRMTELTRSQMEPAELDASIEKARSENRDQFMDINFRPTGEEEAVYAFIPTGQRAYHKNREIFGGFYRMNPTDRWKGVYLEQEPDILKQLLTNQRKRSALEDYTYIYDYSHIAKVCGQEFAYRRTPEEWANYLGGVFIQKERDKQIFSFPTGSYFAAEELAEDGRKMFFWMERNDKPGAKQKGFGISLVDEKNLLEKWCDFQHKYTLDRLVFASWESQDHFVAEVAATAMPENWGRMNPANAESQFGNPVLKSYLEYTLIRLRHLDEEQEGYLLREGDHVYYNTGLLNKFFRQILIGAHLKTITQSVPGLGNHSFEYYYDPYIIVSGHDTKFPTEQGLLDFPRLAGYFEKKEDVLYDASLEIMLNDEHIFEDGLEEGRIPLFRDEYQQAKNNLEEIKNLHVRVQARVQTAIQRARLLAERNHKLAVPQFWRETSEVQFLLPLYMEEAEYTGRPQCALALRRAKNGGYYEGATILSLDMAYNNARLIAKPDVTWLNRVTPDNGSSQVPELSPLAEQSAREEIVPRSPVIPNTPSPLKRISALASAEKPEPVVVAKPTPVAATAQSKTVAPAPVKVVAEPPAKTKSIIVSRSPEPAKVAVPPTLVPSPVSEKPQVSAVGRTAQLTDITSRPGGKGLRGVVLGCYGTVARGLLKHPVPHYTGKTLQVKITSVNPQGNQYLLEPVE